MSTDDSSGPAPPLLESPLEGTREHGAAHLDGDETVCPYQRPGTVPGRFRRFRAADTMYLFVQLLAATYENHYGQRPG
jgi:hypothetical protein